MIGAAREDNASGRTERNTTNLASVLEGGVIGAPCDRHVPDACAPVTGAINHVLRHALAAEEDWPLRLRKRAQPGIGLWREADRPLAATG